MRSTSRITGCSINTISKLVVDAGEACAKFHDETVRGVASSRVQWDELWSFCYAKAKKVPYIQGNLIMRVASGRGRPLTLTHG